MTVYEFIEDKINRYKNYFHHGGPKIAVIYSNSNDYERLRNKFKNHDDYIIYGNNASKFIGQNLVGVIVSINCDFDIQTLLLTLEDRIRTKIKITDERICIQNI